MPPLGEPTKPPSRPPDPGKPQTLVRRPYRSRARARALRQQRNSAPEMLAVAVKNMELTEDEVAPGMSDLQLGLLRSKKFMERQLAWRLEKDMESKDNLIAALKRSRSKPDLRDKVVSATYDINNIIKSTLFKDPANRARLYRIEVDMGLFIHGLIYRRDDHVVIVEGSTEPLPNEHPLNKEVKVEFPLSVEINKLVVCSRGSVVEMRVPFKKWLSTPCLFEASRNLDLLSADDNQDTKSVHSDGGTTSASLDDSGLYHSDTESLPETSNLREVPLTDHIFRSSRYNKRFVWRI